MLVFDFGEVGCGESWRRKRNNVMSEKNNINFIDTEAVALFIVGCCFSGILFNYESLLAFVQSSFCFVLILGIICLALFNEAKTGARCIMLFYLRLPIPGVKESG